MWQNREDSMSDNKTGGPAFPWTADRADRGDVPGMSLRDYFAAKAMQGMLASNESPNWTDEYIAISAYRLADAMLKARE